MKARVKATGEIVEVMGTTQYDNYDVISKDGVYFSLNQLELIGQSLTKNKSEDEDYWEKLKHQYRLFCHRTRREAKSRVI